MSKRTSRSSKKQRQQKTVVTLSAVDAITSAPPCDSAATQPPPQEKRMSHALVAVALMALCASLYVWTADFPMVFDDHTYLKDNALFRDSASFSYPTRYTDFVRLPLLSNSDPDLSVNFVLRPVAYATFHLNYLLDQFNPRWFRAVNILVHALNSLLIFALLRVLLKKREPGPRSALFIPAAAAFLFAAHPLATESVTYIIQRFTSLGTLFFLLTLWCYFNSLEATSRRGALLWTAASVLAVLAGMLSKECAFTAPLMAVLLDYFVLGTPMLAAARRAWPLLVCLPLIPIQVLMASAALHGDSFSLANAFNIVNSRDAPLSHWHYLVTQVTVLATYLRRIFWPSGLNIDPEWPLHRSLFEQPVILCGLVLLSLLAGSWLWWRRQRDDSRSRLMFVFVLWFFITVSTSSGLVPLPDLMADHRSYLPSIGIFVLIACLLDWVRKSSWRHAQILAPGLLTVWVAALAWSTCLRNVVWRTRESLWEDTVAKSPNKYRTWGNLGAAYSDGGKEEKAVECYKAALKIEPRFQNGLLNLSNSLLRLNRPKESLENTVKLIQMDNAAGAKPPVAFTLGLGLTGVGRYDEAVSVFRQILTVMPDDLQTRKALGLVYYQAGLPHRALDHFRHAASVHPHDQQLRTLIQAAEAAQAQKGGRF
jgi:hypothetical protein